jgi:hypothetical protein
LLFPFWLLPKENFYHFFFCFSLNSTGSYEKKKKKKKKRKEEAIRTERLGRTAPFCLPIYYGNQTACQL